MINKLFKLIVGMLFIAALAGCFGEDYDVGVPTAHLHLETGLQNQQLQLKEANISWSSSSGDVEETIDNIEEFGLSQNEIRVSPNQEASLEFQENEENGGDIWTDPTITASLWKDGEQINIGLNDYREFDFPTVEGKYVLEVQFIDSANSAQYIGNIVIEEPHQQAKITDGKLPEFTLMEVPSIKKVQSVGSDGVVFDNSYSEVCWNNCNDDNTYWYPDIHSGDVEKGDILIIDWHKMKPQPTEIYLNKNTENDKVEKVTVDVTNTPLKIEVDQENIGAQYTVEFLWKEGNNIIGKSMLNFRFE